MPFPNAEQAVIAEEKIRDYLLNPNHPVGGSKAAWFASRYSTGAALARGFEFESRSPPPGYGCRLSISVLPRFATRIHVLLVSHAPVGLVIRRGQSKCVATVLWDRRRVEFRLGQWLNGRIYERRSDLSPDGKYAICFAMNGK